MPQKHLDRVLRHAERDLSAHLDAKPAEFLELYQRFLKREEYSLKLAHQAGEGGRQFTQKRSELISVVLRHVWDHALATTAEARGGEPPKLALLAIGGFGRGELNPASDVDIKFIRGLDKDGKPSEAADSVVQAILYILWDIGFQVGGHATHMLSELTEQANDDLQSKTALLEARYLAGDAELYRAFERTFDRACIQGREKEYVDWRLADQETRHQKLGGTVFLQEPNVKNSSGGLRDYQSLLWIARVKRDIRTTLGLQEAQLITAPERKAIDRAYDFILRLRTEMHFQQKRKGDQLTLQLQGKVANSFHYPERNILRRTEALMREYYQHANALFLISNTLSRRLAASQFPAQIRATGRVKTASKSEKIDVFVLQDGILEATEAPTSVFKEDPMRLLRVFLISQQRNAELGPSLRLRIRRRLGLVNRPLIYQNAARDIVLTIFSRKGHVARICRSMHEVGILGRVFPEFEPLTCLVQHEFFHRYTADEHTLVCLEMLDNVIHRDEPPFRRYKPIMLSLEQAHILYLAMLLHDTGKSTNSRNHSEDSAQNAVKVARRLRLGQAELSTLVFLVDHHLTMSETARRKNLDDEETIAEFARVVQTPERLDALMLLTFADYAGTGSIQSADWKETLQWQLYHRTREALTNSKEFQAVAASSLTDLQQRAIDQLKDEIDASEVDAHFKNLPARYFHTLPEALIVAHIQIIHEFLWHQIMHEDAVLRPIVQWRDHPDQGHSEVIIVTWNRDRTFAKVTGAFAACGLSILSATIFAREDDIVIDTFRVTNERWEAVSDERDKKEFQEILGKALAATKYEFVDPVKIGRPLSGFEEAEFPTRISYDTTSSRNYTLLDIQTPDKPGLLYRIAGCLADAKIDLDYARITTENGAALDTFYLCDRLGRKITGEATLAQLTTNLRRRLER